MENILNPLLGGLIIGLAATMMLAFNGKIAGISGILAGTLTKISKVNYWRYAFIFGLVSGAGFMHFVAPGYFQYELNFSLTEAVFAGLLVGFGTRLGSGCTSGHGVCGLPRLAPRSIVATALFMSVAILTVFLKRLI